MKLVEGGWEWLNCFNHPKKQDLKSGLFLISNLPAGVELKIYLQVGILTLRAFLNKKVSQAALSSRRCPKKKPFMSFK